MEKLSKRLRELGGELMAPGPRGAFRYFEDLRDLIGEVEELECRAEMLDQVLTCPECGAMMETFTVAKKIDKYVEEKGELIIQEFRGLRSKADALDFLREEFVWAFWNANDVFAWACADCVRLDFGDLDALLKAREQYGIEGVWAWMSLAKFSGGSIREPRPQEPWFRPRGEDPPVLDEKKFDEAIEWIKQNCPPSEESGWESAADEVGDMKLKRNADALEKLERVLKETYLDAIDEVALYWDDDSECFRFGFSPATGKSLLEAIEELEEE